MEPEVSEINIMPFKQRGSFLGFANCVIGRPPYRLYLGGIAIHCDPAKRSFRLVFPTKRLQNGEEIPLYHPIEKELGNKLQNAIISEWERLIQ